MNAFFPICNCCHLASYVTGSGYVLCNDWDSIDYHENGEFDADFTVRDEICVVCLQASKVAEIKTEESNFYIVRLQC